MFSYKSSRIRKKFMETEPFTCLETESFTCLRRNGPKTVIAVDYATAVCLQRWHAKRPRLKLPSYSSLNSQEMPLSFKHIFAVIPYTMPLFWRRPYIHGMVRIYMCPKVMFIAAPFRPWCFFPGDFVFY